MELKAEGWSGLKIYHPRGETAYTGWSGEGDTAEEAGEQNYY